MIAHLIRFVLTQRLMVLVTALGLSAAGAWSFLQLPIDAFPDVSSPQVVIIVKAPGMAPLEVEQRITRLIEVEVNGIPRQTVLRSLTKYALSSITIDFEEGTDIYWARQQVSERLNQVWSSLPSGVEAGLAPIITPLGEAYMFMVEGEGHSNIELRGLLDWVIRPRLLSVEGVADVNALGGEVRSYHVTPDPEALLAMDLNIGDLKKALENNNRNAGGDRVVRNNEVLLVRTVGHITSGEDIENITVTTQNGQPIHIKDLASVQIGSLTRYGGVTKNGEGEFVEGIVLNRMGANASLTVAGVKTALKEIEKSLPDGVKIVPFYDRTDLVNTAIGTVKTALSAAFVLVVIVLIIFLGYMRGAITVAAILPLSILFTFILMYLGGVSANLMSLGGLAIAIGVLVDPAVVVVENIQTHLARRLKGVDPLHVIYRAVIEVAQPVVSGTLIIIVVFLPLLSLSGLEGKLFTPLAITITLALAVSMLIALTVIPVLASFLMKCGPAKENRLIESLKNLHRPIIAFALSHRKWSVGVSMMLLAGAISLYPFIGKEFMPVLDEGMTVVIVEKLPSISLERSLEIDGDIQTALMALPEIEGVAARMGSDELRLDPMGLYQTDNFLLTKPRSEWTVDGPAELEVKIREILDRFPGIVYAFTQPIDMRVSEMLTGVRAALAVKLYGEDLALLEETAKKIEALVAEIPGSVDLFRTDITGQRYLEVRMRSEVMSRFGINTEDINELISTAVGGNIVTEVMEGVRRTPVLLRYPESMRNSAEAIGNIRVDTPTGDKVPISLLADIVDVDGPVQVVHEGILRQVVIQTNLEGRDIVGFVDEIRAAIDEKIVLPPGFFVEFGGQFENQQRAAKRLAIVVPIAIALIFLFLFTTFNSVRQAGLIILNIPFAMIGGIVALYFSGLYLSVPASVGFIALFGMAIMNGIVMVSYFNQLREEGLPLHQAVLQGAERRLRPVLMTAITTGLALIPLLIATGPGSELQKPLAIVVIGGLFTSTLLTLILLPTLYAWFEGDGEEKIQKEETGDEMFDLDRTRVREA
ncbi:MAG: CusA/CzcA family heavy metal efflux RND transporter [Nitrospira sp.]|nr:efflux RND transporter permease subunit [Candidatus Manganitrophaceae bacterium]HIL35690.1 efflux RND transporter permease subunit [Candidatus Manganitrophaceae bacterium]